MEEVDHFNIGVHQTETGTISIVITRLWPSLLRFTLKLMYEPMKGYLIDGICLTILNNLALVVEGFITDIITEMIKGEQLHVEFNPERATWSKKIAIYPKLSGKSLSEYPQYEAIEILFILRNNIAHGRSHSEIAKKNAPSDEWTYIESENKNYQIVRDFLVQKGLMERKINPSNFDAFWQPLITAFFCSQIEQFLFAVINDLDDKKSFGIFSELRTACQR